MAATASGGRAPDDKENKDNKDNKDKEPEKKKDDSVSFRMPEQSNDYRVVVFGGAGVGKSSLVLRFVKGSFKETYIPTIEDTYRQVISCNKNICTLQITDTTGSHQFPAMQRLSITKAHAFVMVYSVTSKQSLEELQTIWQAIHENRGPDMGNVPVMLVGNKIDEEENREVELSTGEELAEQWNCSFLETSAKTNYNVQELFQQLLNMERHRNITIQLENQPRPAGNFFTRHFKCDIF